MFWKFWEVLVSCQIPLNPPLGKGKLEVLAQRIKSCTEKETGRIYILFFLRVFSVISVPLW